MGLRNVMILVYVLMFFLTVNGAVANEVFVEDNLIRISSDEVFDCYGTLCTIYVEVENLDSVNRLTSVSSYFHNLEVEPLNVERWGKIYDNVSVNLPYVCNSYFDVNDNGSFEVFEYCNNVSSEIVVSDGFVDLPNTKIKNFSSNVHSEQILINKNTPQIIKYEVYQPLGQRSKFDVITDNWDGSRTILDPFVDSDNYFINLSNYRYNFNDTYVLLNFDDGIHDDSDNGVTVTNDDGVWVSNSKVYGGVNFSAGSSRVNITKDADLTNLGFTDYQNYSYGGWIYNMADGEYFIRDNGGASSRITLHAIREDAGGDRLRVNLFDGVNDKSWYSTAGLVDFDNNWTHIIVTRNEGTVTIYLNGNQDTQSTQTLDQTNQANEICIGSHCSGTAITGAVDEVAIWGKTLSAEEVSEIYNYSKVRYMMNADLNNENLTFNSTKSGVEIDYNTSIILQFNDTALGNNLENSECYTLNDSATEINWSLKVYFNTTFDDLGSVVNYTFTNCTSEEASEESSSGGGASTLQKILDYEPELWKTIEFVLLNIKNVDGWKQLESDLNVEIVQFLSFFVANETNPDAYVSQEDLVNSFDELTSSKSSGKKFDNFTRKMIGWFISHVDVQMVVA